MKPTLPEHVVEWNTKGTKTSLVQELRRYEQQRATQNVVDWSCRNKEQSPGTSGIPGGGNTCTTAKCNARKWACNARSFKGSTPTTSGWKDPTSRGSMLAFRGTAWTAQATIGHATNTKRNNRCFRIRSARQLG